MEYFINLGIMFCIYAILGISLNMVVGLTGLVSLAQAAFYGVGAYATAVGMTKLGISFSVSIILGMIINGAIALVIGRILSKFKGDYYAIVSAGLSIIIFSILMNWKTVTNGSVGVYGIERPELLNFSFISANSYFLLSVVLTMVIYFIYHKIDTSDFGRTLKAIRQDEELVKFFNYKSGNYKNIIFVLSAVFSGVAGSLYASYVTLIDPMTFQLKEGIFIFTIIIVGGLSSAKGTIAGVIILISMPEILRYVGLPYETAAQIQQIVYGVMLMIMMLIRPKGLFGKYRM